MNRALTQRLKRLDAALIPAEPHILTITTIAAATGEIIRESHLVMYALNKPSRQTRYCGESAQAALLDRQ